MRLNTNGDIFPAGPYRFRITTVPEKGQTDNGYVYYQFQFAAMVDNEERPYSERFMVWLLAPLCRAIGFEEVVPGEFEFDATWCLNKEVNATIVHEQIAKGASAGKIVPRMKDITPVPERTSSKRAAMSAQAPLGKDEDVPF